MPLGSVLTESDGPVSFGPLGGASGPNLIPSVLFGLAGVRGETYEDVEHQVEENAKSVPLRGKVNLTSCRGALANIG